MNKIMLAMQFASAALEIVLCYFFLGFLSRICKENIMKYKVYIVICIIVIGIQIYFNKRISFFSYLFFPTEIILVWISVFLIIRERKWMHFLIIWIFNIILTVFDFLGAFGLVQFTVTEKLYNEFLFNNSNIKIIILLVVRIIIMMLLISAALFIKRDHLEIQLESKKLFIINVVGTGGILYLQSHFVNQRFAMSVSIWFFLLFIIMILIILSALVLAYMNMKQKEQMISMRNELLEQNYLEVYDLYRMNAEQFHDFKNHLNIIYEYSQEQKWDKVTEYVSGIREPMACLERRVWSGNDVIDLILNYKRAEAVKAGIQCEIDTDKLKFRHISDQDLCTVFSNIMDNSIEACEKVSFGKPWIKIIIRSKGNIFVLKVTNSLGVKPIEENGKLITMKTKKGLHGLGLMSIRGVVEKYEGIMKYRYDDKEFEISITMYD